MNLQKTVAAEAQEASARASADSARWRGRPCVRLANGKVCLTVLHEGGVIAEFGWADESGGSSHNLLWESPWMRESPVARSDNELQRLHGDLGTGRFLERFTGHALCLNEFGPATEEDVAAGGGLHGEASLMNWSFSEAHASSTHAIAELPRAMLRVERRFAMLPDESVVRVDEGITNLSEEAQPLYWVQHATIGAPVFGAGSFVVTSARQGLTGPGMYGQRDRLLADAKFVWPQAPSETGTAADLRELFVEPGIGFVTALHQPAERVFGFVGAVNSLEHVALVYVFTARNFPWLTLWEENHCRQEYPWNGRVQARGLEFGSSPFPLGKREIEARGDVLGRATSRRIAPGERVRAPWAMVAVRSADLGAIDDVVVEEDLLQIVSGGRSISVQARGLANFLRGDETE